MLITHVHTKYSRHCDRFDDVDLYIVVIVIVSVNNFPWIDSFSMRQSYTHRNNVGLIQRSKYNSSIAVNMVSCSVKLHPQIQIASISIAHCIVCSLFFFSHTSWYKLCIVFFYCHSLPTMYTKKSGMKAILQFHLIISVCYCCSVNRKYSLFLCFVPFPIHWLSNL